MFKKIVLMIVLMSLVSTVVFAQGRYSIKSMTPQVQQALDARKERFSQLRSLKSSGAVGENNRGYVEVLNNTPQAESIVSAENRDRKIVYTTIAEQNGLEGALASIESAFADVQREKAESKDKIQSADGRWETK